MEIRKMKPAEVDQNITLGEFAFQFELSTEQREDRKKIIKPENTWVAVENKEIASKLTIFPSEIYIAGEVMKMGGISGVATWPEKRRSGLVRELLRAAMKDVKERGCEVSLLYPFSFSFYRKFGWELFADAKIWTLSSSQLPQPVPLEQGTIYRVTQKAAAVLQPIYEKWAVSYTGAVLRDKQWWEDMVLKRKTGEIAVFKNEQGEDRGYIIYKIKNQKMEVKEFIWLDEETRTALWSFLAQHDSMITEVEIRPAVNDPSRFLLADSRITEKRESYFMARIVDMTSFLQKYPLHLKEGEELDLKIEDDFCEWNKGFYTLENVDGSIHIRFYPGHSEKEGLEMNIQTAAAVFMGYITAEQAWKAGRIQGKPEQVALLQAGISDLEPFIYDFF
ncbi:enhanced intracellular survival protein Eis [Sinobaca sp. H24]|uniref:GNAT family N-acetyltransferase n=1 Tax=Sinobaca sp. H24 TaxID=2923376 RepID=UPI002079B1E4|nr:GNAT family N-acetyltransferase [Sinobaca sp. H24]